MSHNNEHKIDPRLRRPVAARGGKKDRYAQVFIEAADLDTRDWVRRLPGVKDFVNVVDGYCTATVRRALLKKLRDHPGVVEIEMVRFFRPQLDQSVGSIHGWDEMRKGERLKQGAGVVIGIVDYGLDFTLKDFQNGGKGATRIAYLWDQALVAKKAGGKSPEKYKYGVEYSRKQIDAALRAMRQGKDPFKVVKHDPRQPGSTDIDGHGTHVAGIAAGNGKTADRDYPADKYVGVAPDSTLVFVNLDRQAMLEQVGTPRGTLANSVNLAHAVAYCFEKADALNMPCVVNLSMGFNGGGHDGDMAVEWIIDALLQKSGRAVVISAGNEDDFYKKIYSGDSLKQNERVEIGWENGDEIDGFFYDDPTTNELEVWYSRRSKLRVRLVAPGDMEKSSEVEPGQSCTFRFQKGEEANIISDQATPWQGAARIHIELSKGTRESGIRFGTWTVELEATHVAPEEPRDGVRFDAWIERTIPDDAPQYMRSRFTDYDASKAITLTTPSTARSVITVASYSNGGPTNEPIPDAIVRRDSMAARAASRGPTSEPISDFSGRGPTRDERKKPELAAPGDSVYSSNVGAGQLKNGVPRPARVQRQGTSMSAPHVTGVVARLLSRQRFLTAEEIRQILVESANQSAVAVAWDPKWGYGKVDAARAMQLLDDLLGS